MENGKGNGRVALEEGGATSFGFGITMILFGMLFPIFFPFILPPGKFDTETPFLVFFGLVATFSAAFYAVCLCAMLTGPYRKVIVFDPSSDSVEVELRYIGLTVKRKLGRDEVASFDWIVFSRGDAEGETSYARLQSASGVALLLSVPREKAVEFAQALGRPLEDADGKGPYRTPRVWNAKRWLGTASVC